MNALSRHSEPYRATGGLAAEGVLNQLGRPDIDALEVLVREAVQNCWDARRLDEPSVTVEIGKHQLSDSAAEALRGELLVDPPPGLELDSHIAGWPTLLYFADFGTTGLGGPTRGDRATERTNSDFADFVFNIGQPPDKELGGGSFGYGKAAFFIASAAKTIIIDTFCATAAGTERRLIACALGRGFVAEGVPYTGRHWWGVEDDGVLSPLTGAAAANLAARLGLPDRRTSADLGTTIAVVAPDLDLDDDMPTPISMPFVAEALAWNFWPKMIAGAGGRPTMRFRVLDEGVAVPVPDPRRHPRLKAFAEALDLAREDDEAGEVEAENPLALVRTVASLRPRQQLGRLAIVRTVAQPDNTQANGPQPLGATLTSNGIHHVALMRSAELVVRYLPGREPATGRFGYAGVFKCAMPVDSAFRQAEPPTHDDWVARALPAGPERTFINVALRRVQEVCREVAGVPDTNQPPGQGEQVPLGAFADSMATLMPAFTGIGARRQTHGSTLGGLRPAGPNAGGSVSAERPSGWTPADTDSAHDGARTPQLGTPPSAALRVRGEPELRLDPELGAVMASAFEVRGNGASVRLSARVEVMTGDGEQMEKDPPIGWSDNRDRCWITASGARIREPEPVIDTTDADVLWWVLVPTEPEAMLRVDVRAIVVQT